MRANVGNIVAYALAGVAHQAIASADASDVMAQTKLTAAIQEHAASCKARGVPFAVKVVHECAEVDALGALKFAEYTELHPHNFAPITETCGNLSDIFGGTAKKTKGA